MKTLTRQGIILLKKENLKKLRGRGHKKTIKQIAKLCGVSQTTISDRLKEYKIK